MIRVLSYLIKKAYVKEIPIINSAIATSGFLHVTKAKPSTAPNGMNDPIPPNILLTLVRDIFPVCINLSDIILESIFKIAEATYGKADIKPF